ncbi:MAG: tol-pal system protein YbgF [Pseudomonadales bacterium]|jgi:tol-pal system protein YbgF|nr:tol-pal system protein YbgF [Pseudomonadales bacterium]
MAMYKITLHRVLAAAVALVIAQGAQAQLFGGDDEARRAILDLRQRFDQAVTAQNRLVDENTQQRRSMMELQQQIESLRTELAQARGQTEQLAHDLADVQRNQTTLQQTLDDRLNKLDTSAQPADGPPDSSPAAPAEPVKAATGSEKQEYDAALATFRAGDFRAAQNGFANFVKRYPRSSTAPSALFWLGNAQYATRDYREAITNFRALLTAAPNHQRAPEAMLSIANCQIELKDTRAARATLESLLKTYPQSEAAQAGKDRLTRLK